MMNKYKFDIVVLSKTWLKNNNSQLEHVHIIDYKSEFKDRESKPEAELVSILKNIRVLTFDTMLEELMNRLRFSGLGFKVEIRTHRFLLAWYINQVPMKLKNSFRFKSLTKF